MKKYVKLFIGTAVPFGLISGLILSLLWMPNGQWVLVILGGLFSGAFYGVLMVASLGTLDAIAVKKAGCLNASVVQEAKFVTSLPKDDAIEACITALQNIKRSKVRQCNRIEGFIEATTGMTWRSFGENIRFHIRENDPEKREVVAMSRPRLRTTLVDYGKNFLNVQHIRKSLINQSDFAPVE